MEEEKAAAYYEELTRKGEGAAKFKQGLGYSSHSSNPNLPSTKTTPSSSSFLTAFVRASSPSRASETEKKTQLHNIQNKLKKHVSPSNHSHSFHSSSRKRDGSSRRRRRSGSESSSSEKEERLRIRERSRRRRSRSSSPRVGRSEKRRGDEGDGYKVEGGSKGSSKEGISRDKNVGVDYSRVIDGYDKMTPAERVKAKMKLQLSQTVAKDTVMGAGWERFDFDQEAPLDDEEIEVAEDDAALVKDMGRSFRFSAVEAKREEEIKAAHDEAMFGSTAPSSLGTKNEYNQSAHDEAVFGATSASHLGTEREHSTNFNKENDTETGNESRQNLMSDKVLAMKQGSWRDRARKVHDGSKTENHRRSQNHD
ncbi:serine/arginine-rich splicing factor [Tasmannia lanceolata]|uniref:serine/arginine-rich splicing factor n=1 Tax=Tasmannia lanceolata TaxID=3420 RepID=UPI004063289C